jgi:hypothetical protein
VRLEYLLYFFSYVQRLHVLGRSALFGLNFRSTRVITRLEPRKSLSMLQASLLIIQDGDSFLEDHAVLNFSLILVALSLFPLGQRVQFIHDFSQPFLLPLSQSLAVLVRYGQVLAPDLGYFLPQFRESFGDRTGHLRDYRRRPEKASQPTWRTDVGVAANMLDLTIHA